MPWLLLLLAAGRPPETRITVALPARSTGDAAGRLLIFAEPATAENAAVQSVDTAEFGGPSTVWVAARDVVSFGSARQIAIDTQDIAFPDGFASLPPGPYRMQAVLDRDGTYTYAGRGPRDLVSRVVTIGWPQAVPSLIPLDHAVPERGLWDFSDRPKDDQDRVAAVRPHLDEILYPSASLSGFWGRPILLKAWVLKPPDYDPKASRTYPTIYRTGGFTTSHRRDIDAAAAIWALETQQAIPPMLWVFLDQSSIGTGTTEFADSLNNGPWGQALTTELIPSLEATYRMDATPSGRFLTGHSSGGWASLWLMVTYPRLFGGSWPTSPDPSDFHSFTGVDLYAPHANLYRDPQGHLRPLWRDHDRLIASLQSFAKLETVLGHNGGQFRSFEWTFSPRGPDGTPMPMFDRTTGAVDPVVVDYWRDHYDVARLIERHGPALRRDLGGKVHLTVGTADSFYLDGPARLLDQTLQKAGIPADFVYLPDKTHMDLYRRGTDDDALTKDIAWQMMAVARPGTAHADASQAQAARR